MKGHTFDTNGFFFILKVVGTLSLVFALGQFFTGNTNTGLPVIEHQLASVNVSDKNDLITKIVTPPLTSADAYIVADLETGEILLEKNSEKERPIASLTKIMTAIIADETIPDESPIYVSQSAINTEGYQGGLETGDLLTLSSLLYPLLLESSNDASEAIAEHRGRSNFIYLMNRKAEEIQMVNTVFSDPSGLSPNNTSTAIDLYRLANYAYKNKRHLLRITSLPSADIFLESDLAYKHYKNNNPLAVETAFAGGKNGYTDEARKTLLTVLNMPYKNTSKPILIIVLGSENHAGETRSLYTWLQESVEN